MEHCVGNGMAPLGPWLGPLSSTAVRAVLTQHTQVAALSTQLSSNRRELTNQDSGRTAAHAAVPCLFVVFRLPAVQLHSGLFATSATRCRSPARNRRDSSMGRRYVLSCTSSSDLSTTILVHRPFRG